MSYGILEYDDDGKVKCEICGKYFERVNGHVRQKHHISERDYKLQFGFDLSKGICSERSRALSRERTYQNYDKCIQKNLIVGGEKTRYKKGCDGRLIISEQTRIRLSKLHLLPTVKESMIRSGKKLANSGFGNKKRWNENK